MKQKISFLWFGMNGRYGVWRDGLWKALKHLEKDYDVFYQEPHEEIDPEAIILFWEAPCTFNGKDGDMYKRIQNLPNKKILLFAGGPVQADWVFNFDLVCVESKINAEEFERLGIPHMTAFGINEEIMHPMTAEIIYDGIHHGTCASWKRQWLVGEALGSNGLVVGRYQKEDPHPFDECKRLGCVVMDEQPPEQIAYLLNQAHCCVQTSDYWGGGQRCTLEAMACGVPVICMTDSPKNREYVEESGFGLVVEPKKYDIQRAVEVIKEHPFDPQIGREYIMSKWTSVHYKDNLIKAIHYVS